MAKYKNVCLNKYVGWVEKICGMTPTFVVHV
jgi:hypothetical protein